MDEGRLKKITARLVEKKLSRKYNIFKFELPFTINNEKSLTLEIPASKEVLKDTCYLKIIISLIGNIGRKEKYKVECAPNNFTYNHCEIEFFIENYKNKLNDEERITNIILKAISEIELFIIDSDVDI